LDRTTLSADAGYATSFSAGRRGRATSSPPQLGHRPFNLVSAHAAQNVHSNEQMRASAESGARSHPQHSQLGLRSSIEVNFHRRSNDRVERPHVVVWRAPRAHNNPWRSRRAAL